MGWAAGWTVWFILSTIFMIVVEGSPWSIAAYGVLAGWCAQQWWQGWKSKEAARKENDSATKINVYQDGHGWWLEVDDVRLGPFIARRLAMDCMDEVIKDSILNKKRSVRVTINGREV